MNKRAIAAALFAALLLLAGCEGGGSSSETESTIVGQVFYPGDIPVVDARVSLMPARQLQDGSGSDVAIPSGVDTVLLETLTDSEGRFFFTGVTQGYYALGIRKVEDDDTLSTETRVEVDDRSTVIQLPPQRLQTGAKGQGLLTAPAGYGPKSMLYLYGQSWTDSSDDLGRFSLPSLPSGLYLLRVVPVDPALGALEVSFRPGNPLDTLALGPEKVLRVADFENGEKATPFAAAYPKGQWFTVDNLSPIGGPQTFVPSSMRTNFASAYVDSGAFRGHSLHYKVTLAGNPAATYGIVGFASGDGNTGLNFTGVDSVVFYAKGAGLIRAEFQTAIIAKSGDWRQFRKEVALKPEWTRVSIPISQFTLQPDSPALKNGLTWAVAGKNVIDFVFIADDPADVWLDDLEFYGVSVMDLAP